MSWHYGKVNRGAHSGLWFLLAVTAGVGGAGCMEEVGSWDYCTPFLIENHTSGTVRVGYSIGSEKENSSGLNFTETGRPRLERHGSEGDDYLHLHGSPDRMQRLVLHHESGSVVNRSIVAEHLPSGWHVVEYRSEGFTFGFRADDWDRSPCNYPSALK